MMDGSRAMSLDDVQAMRRLINPKRATGSPTPPSETFTTSSNANTDRYSPDMSDVASNISQVSRYTQRDATMGGGRLGKSTRTWGNLPSNIIHKIIDYSLPQVEAHWTLEQAWAGRKQSYTTASTIARRIELCKLRLLSRAWRHAVDSHSFWPEYTLILDPSKSHGSIIADIHSSRLTPSTPTYPTLFHRARSTTLDVCLPCRLNHPNRLGLYPAARRNLVYSNYLGLVPTCHRHRHEYCSCCLREKGFGAPHQSTELLHVRRDVDDEGYIYQMPIICRDCRIGTVAFYIKKELEICARGGPVRSSAATICEYHDYTQDIMSTDFSTVVDIARHAVSASWVTQQTDYDSLDNLTSDLQHLEDRIRLDYIRHERLETKNMRAARRQRLCLLYDEPYERMKGKFNGILNYVNTCYDDWLEDEEFSEEDFASEPSSHWIGVRTDAALYRWARDRIRSGYWVFPSDEVDTLIGHLNLPSRNEIVNTATRPPRIRGPPGDYYQDLLPGLDLGGYIQLEGDAQAHQDPYFLPPRHLLDSLDKMFASVLDEYLHAPMLAHAEARYGRGWRQEHFAQSPPSISELLGFFHAQKECWGPFVADTPVSLSPRPIPQEPIEKRRSPRIEALPLEDSVSDQSRFIIEVDPEVDAEGSTVSETENESSSGSGESGDDRSPSTVSINGVVTMNDIAPSIEVTPNGKRKSPPAADQAERPTKRRPSTETDGDVDVDVSITGVRGVKSEDNRSGSGGSTASDPLSTSVSQSDPSEPMPVTPDLDLLDPTLLADIAIAQAEIEAKARQDQRLYISKRDIPHIPHQDTSLGPKTEAHLLDLYEQIWEPLRICKCRICERGRLKEQMMVAGAQWTMEEVLAMSERNQ